MVRIGDVDESETLEALAAGMRAAAGEIRLRLLALLYAFDEPLCVCELASGLDLPEYEVSRHLRALRRGGLVECQRAGLWAYYAAAEGPLPAALRGLAAPSAIDLRRLERRLAQRVGGRCVVGPSGFGGNPP